MLRRVALGNMVNLRDLGGYPTADGRVTAWERLFRGDTPTGLSEADLQWLLDRDVTTIIDLRSGEEVRQRPDQLAALPQFTYHHVSLAGGDMLPNLEADVGRGYFGVLERKVGICAVLRLIAAAPGGVLFHCTAGKDRTGMTAMLLLSLVGVGRADILADYQVSETYLEELISRLKASWAEMPAYAGLSKRAYMETCMDLLAERYGSVPDYLRAIGLTNAELEALRAKLLA